MSSTLSHPELGTVIGIDHKTLTEFKGIKYASLVSKFAEAILYSHDGIQAIAAKQPGPNAVTLALACETEQGCIQQSLPHQHPGFSEIDCLNLNIICPKVEAKGIPVFVWIHGGGFALGANSWPHYDLKRIVSKSLQEGKPMIGISINYRLGISGFLTSSEMTRAGFKPNRGLRDQQVALRWIKRYIEGFGGSPDKVTVIAESAGSVGSYYHLQASESLFQQFVSMAGTPLLMKPPPLEFGETQYQNVLRALNIDTVSERERLEQLLTIPATQMLEKVPSSVILVPIVDGDIVKYPSSFKDWATGSGLAKDNHKWCSRILVGDCGFDANILSYMLPPTALLTIREDLVAVVRHVLSEHADLQEELLRAYGLHHDSGDDNLEHVLEFAQDVGFTMPVKTIAESWQGTAFAYFFNEVNPWDGIWKGRSTHVLDIVFLLQNYIETLSDEQKATSQALGKHFIEFVHGETPFPPYIKGEGGAMVYGLKGSGSANFVRSVNLQDYGRRSIIARLAEVVSMDVVSSIWDIYMATR